MSSFLRLQSLSDVNERLKCCVAFVAIRHLLYLCIPSHNNIRFQEKDACLSAFAQSPVRSLVPSLAWQNVRRICFRGKLARCHPRRRRKRFSRRRSHEFCIKLRENYPRWGGQNVPIQHSIVLSLGLSIDDSLEAADLIPKRRHSAHMSQIVATSLRGVQILGGKLTPRHKGPKWARSTKGCLMQLWEAGRLSK